MEKEEEEEVEREEEEQEESLGRKVLTTHLGRPTDRLLHRRLDGTCIHFSLRSRCRTHISRPVKQSRLIENNYTYRLSSRSRK